MQATRLIIRPDTIPYQRLPCGDMDEIRGLFSRMKKGRKDNKRKSKEIRAGAGATSEGASPTSMLPRPVLHVVVGGVRGQEDYWADVEGKEASRKNLHPDAESGLGPSREGSDVDGKKANRSVDPPHSPPSAPSTYKSTSRRSIQSLLLIVPLDNADGSAVPHHVQEPLSPDHNELNTANEKKSDWKSTTSATAKLLLRGVRESTDAFGPLKSVAGGLCFILEICEV